MQKRVELESLGSLRIRYRRDLGRNSPERLCSIVCSIIHAISGLALIHGYELIDNNNIQT